MHEPQQNSSHYSLAVLTTVLKISKKIVFVLVNEKYLLKQLCFPEQDKNLHIFSLNWLTG